MMAGCYKSQDGDTEPEWLEPYREQLSDKLRASLKDPISQVRVGATEALPRLAAAFGMEYIKTEILGSLKSDIEEDDFYQFKTKAPVEKPPTESERSPKDLPLHSKQITVS